MSKDTHKVSVRSIAQHLGISPSTVSVVLNGRRPTSFVSAATRKQVWHAAKELGYPLDQLRARRPLLERVAIFAHAGPNPVFSETVLQFCRILNQRGGQVLIHSIRTERAANLAAQDLYHRQEIDAAVFVGSRQEAPPDLPCVVIGELPPGVRAWQVCPDNEGGGRAVAEYLWSLGHRSVAVLVPERVNLAGEKRLQGLRAYWEERGTPLPESRVLRVEVGADSDRMLRQTLTGFLAADRQTAAPVSALFCFNDWVAATVFKVLCGSGLRVPNEMSVVGYDDSVYADLLDPPLTTVHLPFDTLGVLAAELLAEQLEAPDAEPKRVLVRCHLVVRQSCVPAVSTGNHDD